MSKSIVFYTIMFVLLNVSISCKKKMTIPPYCKIIEPKGNFRISEGNTIKITVIASSENSKIQNVKLYVDYSETDIDLTEPYEFLWTAGDYNIGIHDIKVMATDENGLVSEDEISAEITEYEPVTSFTDLRDGNIYKVVRIGDQVWMAENLKFEHEYSAYVDNDIENSEEYGFLYKTRLGSGEEVSPEGWHVPSPEEWNILIEYLGGDSIAGGKLKETGTLRWNFPNTGATNISEFTARPAGSLTYALIPEAFGKSARFFTSSYGHYIFINYDSDDTERIIYHPSNEYYSIRCIRDY